MEPEPDFASLEALHSRATGFGLQRSETYQCFRDVLELEDEAVSIFREVLNSGTPAARLYSAIGLCKLEPHEGKEALQALTLSTSQVLYWHGCFETMGPVCELAQKLLSKEMPMKLFW